jgi:hypothetical protein
MTNPHDDTLSQVTRSQTLKHAVRWAVCIHILIFVVSYFGLPHIQTPPPDLSRAVQVDLVAPNADMSAAPNSSKSKEPFKPNAKPIEKKKDVKADAKKPPAPVKSDAAKKEVKKPDEKTLEKPVKKEPPKKKDALKKAAEKKTPDKKDSAKKAKDDGKGEQQKQEEFNSVLKNLLGEVAPPAPETGSPVDAPYDPTKAEGAAPTQSDTLALSDIDALKYQLGQCWNIPSGAMDAENLRIAIRIIVNPDRTVQSAEIVDQVRYRSDPFFAAAAESARRAVFHPNCTPLALPPEKYDVWKQILITFNPRDMFGG